MSGTSPHFNHTSERLTEDQLLLEDLFVEQVYIMGTPVYYILRETADKVDNILGEDPTSIFQRAYQVPAYINNPEGWTSGSSFFSKFGLQIDKQNSIVITRRHFNHDIGDVRPLGPKEGDLVYIPVFEKLFEIKLTHSEDSFYTLGKRNKFYYTLDLEMFTYSQEAIDTGIDEIDIIEKEMSYAIQLHLDGGSIAFWNNEIVYQGADRANATVTGTVKGWNPTGSLLDVYDIKGVFSNTSPIIGVSSGATWNIANFDDKENHNDFLYAPGSEIQQGANSTIVRTETNPFGAP